MSGTQEPPEQAKTPESRRRLSVLRKLGFSAAVVLIFVVVMESASRLLVVANVLEPSPRTTTRASWAEDGWEVDPLLGWKLLSNNASFRGGANCVTNSFGHRDHELPLRKPAGEYRVLSIGDSTALGFAVDERVAYAGALEDRLREETRRPVEVINAGVPGYTSAQVLLYLRHRGLAFQPDAVIVQVNFNDRRAISPGSPPDSQEHFRWVHRTLRVRELMDYSMTARLLRGMLGPGDDQDRWFENADLDFKEIAVDSPARVSPAQYEENIRAIIGLAREHGADVYLVGLPDYPDLAASVRRAAAAVASADWDAATKELADEPWFAGSEVYRLVRQKLLNQIHAQAGRTEEVQQTIPANLDWVSTDGYLPTELSGRYIDALVRLGEELGAPVVVPRPPPAGAEIYHDYIHLNAAGHTQVADALAAAILVSDRFNGVR